MFRLPMNLVDRLVSMIFVAKCSRDLPSTPATPNIIAHEKSPCNGVASTAHSGPAPRPPLVDHASSPISVKIKPKEEMIKGICRRSGGRYMIDMKKT
jgi:hypothetical protein